MSRGDDLPGTPGTPGTPGPLGLQGLSEEDARRLLGWAAGARRVTVLTGAGMSAESGVPTFRARRTGLWARYDPLTLATPQAWAADPELVWAWYVWRIGLVRRADPHAGHGALARWAGAAAPDTQVRIVTQNVDDLHERAGSAVLAHLHGTLLALRCSRCEKPYDGWSALEDIGWSAEPVERLAPPTCSCGGLVRPGVVWFGEALPQDAFDAALDATLDADLVLVVGTSGLVRPAATLPEIARGHGIPVVELNPEPTELSRGADLTWRSSAAVGLPALVERIRRSIEHLG